MVVIWWKLQRNLRNKNNFFYNKEEKKMNQPGNIIAIAAVAAIGSRHITGFDGNGKLIQSTSGASAMFGVTSNLDTAAGETADIVVTGVPSVEYGAQVTAGQLLTADANGCAVPAAGNEHTIGVAMLNGNAGDIGAVLITPSQTN